MGNLQLLQLRADLVHELKAEDTPAAELCAGFPLEHVVAMCGMERACNTAHPYTAAWKPQLTGLASALLKEW